MTMHSPINLRHQWAESFAFLLTEVEPGIAAELCAAHLDNLAAGMPGLDPWGDLRADAAFWADSATVPELNAYACAAMRRLGGRMQGRDMRKRLLADIWRTLPAEDRTAFLRKVTGRAG